MSSLIEYPLVVQARLKHISRRMKAHNLQQ
jgi:hypothetical protein